MDPIATLFAEMQKREIKTLLDVNSKFEHLFKGETYIAIDKSNLLNTLDQMKSNTQVYDACSLIGVFWSLPLNTIERMLDTISKKAKYLFIWDSNAPHMDAWKNLINREFDLEVNLPVSNGIVQVWKLRKFPKAQLPVEPTPPPIEPTPEEKPPVIEPTSEPISSTEVIPEPLAIPAPEPAKPKRTRKKKKPPTEEA